jgi:molybdopterin molybdotransferase
MITVEEAKEILIKNIFPISKKTKTKIADALGCSLAEDIYASINLPPFDQSNVDGYAVRFSASSKNIWKVVDEIKAGDNPSLQLKVGEAVRIFTGAFVPKGSDLVIMQEKIIRNGNTISYTEILPLKKGEHIRIEGAQIKKGDLALNKGILLNPAAISFLNALGLTEVTVFNKPKIALIITGNELQAVGSDLETGKIYESNSSALQCALISMGLNVDKLIFVKDDKNSLEKAVADGLSDADMLLISGGISVGDYDFVKEVLKENCTETLFYKIAQKPGKPLFFGKNKNTFIFGLPGNPASALTCFYEYVYLALRKMQGRENIFLNKLQLPILKNVSKKKGLANFLKAKIKGESVEPLEGQESFIMKSFGEANAFIYLPMEKENIEAGERVEVHLLPEF